MSIRQKQRLGKLSVIFVSFLLVLILGWTTSLQAQKPVEKVEKLKIGVIGPMNFIQGSSTWLGARLAAEEINSSGGISVGSKKYQLELAQIDTNEMRSVDDAVNGIERAISIEGSKFIIGGYRSEAVIAMMAVAANHKTIFISTGAGSPECYKQVKKDYARNKYYFSGNQSADQFSLLFLMQLDSVCNSVREKLKVETPQVAILAEQLLWAEPLVKAAQEMVPKLGGKVVGTWRTSAQATDLSAELSGIKKAGAHVIYAGVAGPCGTTFSKQYGTLKIPAAVVGVIDDAVRLSHWKDTGGMCDFVSTNTMSAPVKITGKTIPFWDKVKASGEDPTHQCPGTFDTLYMLKVAIEKAGTLESDPIIKELENIDYAGVRGRCLLSKPGTDLFHVSIWGPHAITQIAFQWRNQQQKVFWPDGREAHAALIEKGVPSGWKGVKFPGTTDFELPPWMLLRK